MQKIKIQTPQNVVIEYEIASIWDRIVANFRDYLIIISYIILLAIISSTFKLNNPILFIFFALPPFLYQLVFESFMNGQSPGMKSKGLKVIRIDGKECTFLNYFLRWVLRPIDVFMFYGGIAMLMIAVTKNGQRLGDLLAGTTVVRLKKQYSLDNTLFVNPENNYVPVFSGVDRLNDRDMEIIKEAIKVYETTGNMIPAAELSKKIKTALDIQTQMDPIVLLKTILKDYYNTTSAF
ncbi:MAG: RDD family protein [Sporocytophaga sp.]|nr:RDD family protein [Sporocytophaga sp.]